MTKLDRRTLLTKILPGAVVTAAGATAIAIGGRSILSSAEAMPLAISKTNPLNVDELFQQAQAVVVVPRRRGVRRRRWVCWSYRGRRRCGWRWVWI